MLRSASATAPVPESSPPGSQAAGRRWRPPRDTVRSATSRGPCAGASVTATLIGWPLSRQIAKPLTANSTSDVSVSGPVISMRSEPVFLCTREGEPVPFETTALPTPPARRGRLVSADRRARATAKGIGVDRQHGRDSACARLAKKIPGRLPVGLRLPSTHSSRRDVVCSRSPGIQVSIRTP